MLLNAFHIYIPKHCKDSLGGFSVLTEVSKEGSHGTIHFRGRLDYLYCRLGVEMIVVEAKVYKCFKAALSQLLVQLITSRYDGGCMNY